MDKAEKVFEKLAVSGRLVGKALGKRFSDLRSKDMQLSTYSDLVSRANKMKELSNLSGRTSKQVENLTSLKPEVRLDNYFSINKDLIENFLRK